MSFTDWWEELKNNDVDAGDEDVVGLAWSHRVLGVIAAPIEPTISIRCSLRYERRRCNYVAAEFQTTPLLDPGECLFGHPASKRRVIARDYKRPAGGGLHVQIRKIPGRRVSQFVVRSSKNPEKLVGLTTFPEFRVGILPNLVVLAAIQFLVKLMNGFVGQAFSVIEPGTTSIYKIGEENSRGDKRPLPKNHLGPLLWFFWGPTRGWKVSGHCLSVIR
jgi:hypothetical protein